MESFHLPSYVFFVGIIYKWESLIYNLEKVEMIVYSHTTNGFEPSNDIRLFNI